MLSRTHRQATAVFEDAIAHAQNAAAIWQALEELSLALGGHRLFTVMTVDNTQQVARRVYSNDPVAYPVTGTKPIIHNSWFEIVHGEQRIFVANTIADIANVFPDFELIESLGCGSVVNLPVVLRGQLVATINLLHAENHYTPERVEELQTQLSLPAKLCCALASQYDVASHG